MAVASGEGLEKLEDMIVRAAETTAGHARTAKAAIGGVIFGQEKVVEDALITVLCGGHAMLARAPEEVRAGVGPGGRRFGKVEKTRDRMGRDRVVEDRRAFKPHDAHGLEQVESVGDVEVQGTGGRT